MKFKLSNGELKDDDSKPIRAGESVFSDKTWVKLVEKADKKDEKELLKQLKAVDKRKKKSARKAKA